MVSLKQVFHPRNLVADVRTTIVSMITVGALTILGSIATAVWKAIQKQPLQQWGIVVGLFLVGSALIIIALWIFKKNPKNFAAVTFGNARLVKLPDHDAIVFGSKLTGLRLRKACDKWIETLKAAYERLSENGQKEQAIKLLDDFEGFVEANFSDPISDYDWLMYFRKFLGSSAPDADNPVKQYQRALSYAFGNLVILRNKIGKAEPAPAIQAAAPINAIPSQGPDYSDPQYDIFFQRAKEKRKRSEERQKAVEDCLDRAAKMLKNRPSHVTSFHALYNSDGCKLESADEVKKVCDGLVELGHLHPFQTLGIPEKEWLEFLVWGKRHPDFHFDKGIDYFNAAQEWAFDHQRRDPTNNPDFVVLKTLQQRTPYWPPPKPPKN